MLGLEGQRVFEAGKLQPLDAWGLKVMSISLVVDLPPGTGDVHLSRVRDTIKVC